MTLIQRNLNGLFGWGVIFVIGACLAAGVELLAPWIETMTWGRGLGITLLLLAGLGVLDLSAGGTGGAIGHALAGTLRSLAGTAGSIAVLTAILLGGLVLAFDLSISELISALQNRYLSMQEADEPKTRKTERTRPVASRAPQPKAEEPEDEPVLVPLQGVGVSDSDEEAEEERDAIDLKLLRDEPEIELVARRKKEKEEPEVLAPVLKLPHASEEVTDEEGRHSWIKPDLSLLFDLPVAVARERASHRTRNGRAHDRLDSEDLAFHTRVREAYLQIARDEPERVRVVNAAASVEETHQQVIDIVLPFLESRGQRLEVRGQ